MNVRDLLERCRAAGLRIRADCGELVIRSAGRAPAALLAELREHKAAALEYLSEARRAHVHPCARCGRVFFAEPRVLCYWCRRDQDGAAIGPPCAGCGEACERCIGTPTPDKAP